MSAEALIAEFQRAVENNSGAEPSRSVMERAKDALRAALEAQAGDWMWAPREPDETMKRCADSNWSGFCKGTEDAREAAARLYRSMLAVAPAPSRDPIPMVLHCPHCHTQHLDKPEPENGWDNPPHASHLCHNCGAIWRPASVDTEGVENVPAGKHDRAPTKAARPASALSATVWQTILDVSVVPMEEAAKGISYWVTLTNKRTGHTITPYMTRSKGRAEYDAECWRAFLDGRDQSEVDITAYDCSLP